jgi:8-oxo-dGTP diphosphatase
MAGDGPIVAVGAVVWRGPGQLLLVRRGQPPKAGEWSIPGGRVEPGERLREALMREIREETGLAVHLAGLIDVAEFIERDEAGVTAAHFVLVDFSTDWVSGDACAASDVAECGWFDPRDALARIEWEETRRIIRLSARQRWELEL